MRKQWTEEIAELRATIPNVEQTSWFRQKRGHDFGRFPRKLTPEDPPGAA